MRLRCRDAAAVRALRILCFALHKGGLAERRKAASVAQIGQPSGVSLWRRPAATDRGKRRHPCFSANTSGRRIPHPETQTVRELASSWMRGWRDSDAATRSGDKAGTVDTSPFREGPAAPQPLVAKATLGRGPSSAHPAIPA
jgi:hypothetical protein